MTSRGPRGQRQGPRRGTSTPAVRVLPILLLALAGCGGLPSRPESPVVLQRPWGSAGGRTLAEAERMVAAVEAARQVLAPLPGFVDRPLSVHLLAGPLPEEMSGTAFKPDRGDPWIEVGDDGGASVEPTTAHELVHVYFEEFSSFLPPLLEEGLCELLSSRVFERRDAFQARVGTAAVSYLDSITLNLHGAEAKTLLRYLVQEVPPIETALELGPDEFNESEMRAKAAYYGLGWMLATCIGFEGLAALVERARGEGLERVPSSWILAAAGLEPLTQETLAAAFARACGVTLRGARGNMVITLGDAP